MILVYLFKQNVFINVWIIDKSTHKYTTLMDELRFIFVLLIIIRA